MTQRKHFKDLVRARMAKTGESYSTARRQILRDHAAPVITGPTGSHFLGNVPGTTALRILLTHAGVRAAHTPKPFTEAMLFGLAGGIGIGVFAFYYAKADHASFFVGGRHLWHDDLAYFQNACKCFGIATDVKESSTSKPAFKALQAALADGSPAIAWVDAATLPHRAMPAHFSGGGYHVIVVYSIDEASGTALIGDLTDEPITIPLADLDRARARIKKQKYRLLSLKAGAASSDLATLVRGGLRACAGGLRGEGGVPSARKNFSLDAVQTWAGRMHNSKDKESWERVFKPGPNLWRGLTSIHNFIENYGTGGGLCRPLFAAFLREAGDALKDPRLHALAERYVNLGQLWCNLADAALPDNVPAFREARELLTQRAELLHNAAPADEVRATWQRLDDLASDASKPFPLPDADCATLRAKLQTLIANIHQHEQTALASIEAIQP